MREQVTIYDVAAKAGVSISTVSLALNRPERVNARTRDRVLSIADDLGFVPRSEAVSRARKALGRIGVVAPFTRYASYLRRLTGVMQELEGEPIEITVYAEESAASRASPLLSSLPLTQRLDGLIVMGIGFEEQVAERLLRRELPTLVVDVDSRHFTSVTTRDEDGGELIAEHLLSRGHRRLAYLIEQAEQHDYDYQGVRRLHGFQDRLAREGIRPEDVPLRPCAHSIDGARGVVARLLAEHPEVTAIACHDDTLAVGALHAAREAGRAVPDDLAVMGFDDGDVAEAAGLTTIRQPLEESGRVAARMLKALMTGGDSTRQQVLLGLELVLRDSA